MTLLDDALRAGRTTLGETALPSALVAGGGGALGSAVLEALLAGRRFAPVRVLATRALSTAMQGLETIVVDDFAAAPGEADGARIADTALIVFDRARHANGREQAFVRPAPAEFVMFAGWLFARGVRNLLVVLPHAPAQLPDALKLGLANLDEQAVAALGFERLVFVRSAQAPADAGGAPWSQRVANGLLSQLRIMVAATHQPVRAAKVAQFVAALADRLGSCAPGTRVVPPELVWQAAQRHAPGELVDAWLRGDALPPLNAPRQRM